MLLLQRAEALDREPPVGRPRERQDRLADVDVARSSDGRPSAAPPRDAAVAARAAPRPPASGFQATPLAPMPGFSTSGPSACHLLGDGAVVALDDDQLRHRLARAPARTRPRASRAPRRAAGRARPACRAAAARRRRRVRTPRCVRRRRLNARAIALNASQSRARLPRRRDRRVERVHERVQVGAREVVLLVPGGGRQDDVGVEARAVHAEVDRREQVELAVGRLVAPVDLARAAARAATRRSGPRRRATPSRWRRKYSWPLLEEPSRFARQSVSTRGKFAGSSGSSQAKRSRPALQLGDDVVGRPRRPRRSASSARSSGLRSKRRIGRQPAEPRGRARGSRRCGGSPSGPSPSGEANSSAPKRLVAPLVGGQVPERRRRLLARRARPVEREGDASTSRRSGAPSPGRRSAPSRRR